MQREARGWRWGVPDWRDSEPYPRPDTTRLGQWRWEFLRRRHDYRECWLLHYARNYRHNVATYRNLPCPEGVRSWEEHFAGSAFAEEVGDRFGTRGRLIDPSAAVYAFNLFRRTGGVLQYASEGEFETLRRAGMAHYQFDLNKPLADQLKAAENHLRRLQAEFGIVPESRRRQVSKWPRYLQVIDAREDGATFEEIGETLIGANPDCSQEDFDRRANLEPKVWAKTNHDRALEVAFNFPA
jgi:hypothetical protein